MYIYIQQTIGSHIVALMILLDGGTLKTHMIVMYDNNT